MVTAAMKLRCLLLGRKTITNLGSILKSRDITLQTKIRLVKAMLFPVVMYGRESWTIKKVERQRIDAFEMWCWRRLLRVSWTARRSNQSILKEISSVQFSRSVVSDWDSTDCSMSGFPVHHQLLELTQTHVHWVNDAIQPSHFLSSPSPPAFNLCQHQGLFQRVSSSYQVAKVLELQPQQQSFQWIFRTDFL